MSPLCHGIDPCGTETESPVRYRITDNRKAVLIQAQETRVDSTKTHSVSHGSPRQLRAIAVRAALRRERIQKRIDVAVQEAVRCRAEAETHVSAVRRDAARGNGA